jgi:hypothetical protein
MKISVRLAFSGLLCASSSMAQVDFPANPTVSPKKFSTRPIGGGVHSGATVDSGKTANPNVRHITYIVLHDSRMWTSAEGKPLEAKLIAFEDLVVEAPKDSADPVIPAPPAHPTVTREGKIRLLVGEKPVEIALDRLSQSDREFIDQMKVALAKKAAAGN